MSCNTGRLLLLFCDRFNLSIDRNASGQWQPLIPIRLENKRPSSMRYRKRGSHVQWAYSTQDISNMRTARAKQQEGADTIIIVKEEHEIWKKATRARRKKVPNKP